MTQLLRVHSIESLGALDGPGLRTVIFLMGCPLRCMYCHNPDTWTLEGGQLYDSDTLLKRILKMKPYFKKGGGVTFSGGEPLVQAKALIPLVTTLKEEGIHIALDTSGAVWNEAVEKLIKLVDLVLLDVKHTNNTMYHTLTGGYLKDTLFFIEQLIDNCIPYWIRQVIVPKINDTINQVQYLEVLTRSQYRNKIELLPFHKKAMHKWEALNMICPLKETPELRKEDIQYLIDEIKGNTI